MVTQRRPRLPKHTVAIVVAAALAGAACTTGSADVETDSTGQPDSTDSVEQPGPADQSDSGTLDWRPCEDAGNSAVSLECATLQVPLDHAVPDGELIDIAVARSAATGAAADRIGSLVFNPGGPGVSGIDSLGFIPLTMSEEISERFDLVSFDPRGVGASTAIACDNDLDDQAPLLAEDDEAGWLTLLEEAAAVLETCTDDTNALAPYVGTNNAARDMDLLRAALGDEQLSYVGYSYGTRLGATYAELFPANVRALVLDAAVKPSRDTAELDREQAEGFDQALENFAAACDADTDCLLRELGATLDVIDGLETEIAEVGSFPTDDPDRVLTPGELELGIVAALYSKDSWPFLASALYTAETDQDGSLLQALGDSLAGREPDGTYDNSQTATGFISCADDPVRLDAAEQRAVAEDIAAQSRHFADFLRASTGCLGLPPASDPLVIGPAAGAAPIVVIGNTGDPATPYEWSEELAAALDSAVLYTVEAEGHTAYGTIDCVRADIDAYLLDLTVPAAGATCSDNADADFFVPEGDGQLDQLVAFFDCVRDEGADIPEITPSDLLADPTLESLFDAVDLTDPAVGLAFGACQSMLSGF